jgi:hypothetical protein
MKKLEEYSRLTDEEVIKSGDYYNFPGTAYVMFQLCDESIGKYPKDFKEYSTAFWRKISYTKRGNKIL